MKPGLAGYVLAAALLCCTQNGSSSGQLPAGVVPFAEVWSRSYCRARETLVEVQREFPRDVEHIFKPPCVPLWRCAGCCNDERMECVAVETRTIDLEVVRVSPIQGTMRPEEMTFTEHLQCVCRPRRKRLKGERNHRMGVKRKPREPSPHLPPAGCRLSSVSREDVRSTGQEEPQGHAEKIQKVPLPPRAIPL